MHKSDIAPGVERMTLRLADTKRALTHPLRPGNVGYLPHNWHDNERRHREIIFGITLSGEEEKLVWLINGREYVLRPPFALFLGPGAVIRNRSAAPWTELYFSYDAALVPVFRTFGFPLGEIRELGIVSQRLSSLIQELLRVCADIRLAGNADRADSLCEAIMVEAKLALPPGAEIGGNEKAAQKIASFIEINFTADLALEELAKKHGLGYRTFLRAWKKLYDYTPQERITSLKIGAACQLLRESDLRADEIAYRLKFTSPLYFSRIFKRKTGMAPTVYRKAGTAGDFDSA